MAREFAVQRKTASLKSLWQWIQAQAKQFKPSQPKPSSNQSEAHLLAAGCGPNAGAYEVNAGAMALFLAHHLPESVPNSILLEPGGASARFRLRCLPLPSYLFMLSVRSTAVAEKEDLCLISVVACHDNTLS